jgi:PAS domain S-box-containing protein
MDTALKIVINKDGKIAYINDNAESSLFSGANPKDQSFMGLFLDKERDRFVSFITSVSPNNTEEDMFLILNADSNPIGIRVICSKHDDLYYLIIFIVSSSMAAKSAYDLVSKTIHIGSWYYLPSRDELYLSREAKKIFGFSRSQTPSLKDLSSKVKSDSKDLFNTPSDQLYKNSDVKVSILKINIRDKDFYINAKTVAYRSNNKIQFIFGIFIDVSEYEKVLIGLKEELSLRNLALKGIESNLFYHDLKSDNLLYGEDFKALLGLPRNEPLEEKEFRKMIVEEDREDAYQRHIAEINSREEPYRNHYRLKLSTGEVRHYKVYGWKRFDGDGKAVFIVGNLIDIEEEVSAKKRNEELVELLKEIINTASVSTVLLDTEGKIIQADKDTLTHSKIKSGNQAELGVTQFIDIVPHYLKSKFNQNFESALKGQLVESINEGISHTGDKEWFRVVYRPIQKNASIRYVLLNVFDISPIVKSELAEISAKQEASELKLLKNNIIQNVKHEIRTPLSGIKGALELLSKSNTDSEQDELIELLNHSSQRLMLTLDNLMRLSEYDIKKDALKYEVTNIKSICDRSLDKLIHFAISKELGIKKIYDNKQYKINTCIEIVEIALDNILHNAIKFTDNGYVEINVTKLDDGVLITVKDTGPGIKKKDLVKIFNEYTQLSTGISRQFEGSGLGLNVSRNYVRLIKGDIKVESEYGKGATFKLFIPDSKE